MLDALQMVLWFLLALVILVTIHEFGHFYVARRCGVKVLRFSVGFGKPFYSWRDRHGTEFALAAIPLGGYVKMVDEREGEVAPADLPYAFTRKTVWQRMAIVVAGPLANFILAVLLFWLLFFVVGRVGTAPFVGGVEAESVAARAGLEPGMEIVAIDGVETPTDAAVARQLLERLGESGTIAFSYKHPDADQVERAEAEISDWLRGVDEPDPLAGIGLTLGLPPDLPPLVSGILADSPADTAGFQAGDRVVAADGEPMSSWTEWVNYVSARPGESIDVVVQREGREIELNVTPRLQTRPDGREVGQVGMQVTVPDGFVRQFRYSWIGALAEASVETWDTSIFVLTTVKKLIFGEISTKTLSGPITIAKVAGSSGSAGWMSFLSFLALISVMLGVFNLLPIPVLDGGHLAYFIIEAIKGSPVSEKAQMIGFQIGLFLIVGVMLLALYNDITRL